MICRNNNFINICFLRVWGYLRCYCWALKQQCSWTVSWEMESMDVSDVSFNFLITCVTISVEVFYVRGRRPIGFFPKKQIISNNSTFVRAKTSTTGNFCRNNTGLDHEDSFQHFLSPPKRKQPPPRVPFFPCSHHHLLGRVKSSHLNNVPRN